MALYIAMTVKQATHEICEVWFTEEESVEKVCTFYELKDDEALMLVPYPELDDRESELSPTLGYETLKLFALSQARGMEEFGLALEALLTNTFHSFLQMFLKREWYKGGIDGSFTKGDENR